MHREIKNYYEDRGRKVICLGTVPSSCNPLDAYFYWGLAKDENVSFQMVAATLNNGTNQYLFNGSWYDEQDALKIIKMPAFL